MENQQHARGAAQIVDDRADLLRREEGSLSIWFRATGRYIYYGVPARAFDELRDAASPGRTFNERIKGRYRCAFDPERQRFRPQRAA